MKAVKFQRGITLIEVIVSMAILSIIAVSLLGIFSSGISSIFSMGRKTKAMAEAQKVMDIVDKSGSITSTSIQSTINNEGGSGYMSFSLDNSFVVTPGIAMNKVTITVSYNNGARSVSLTSLIP
jgi:prepilin-type N-terminal cleavage/methylation domain-containing protein